MSLKVTEKLRVFFCRSICAFATSLYTKQTSETVVEKIANENQVLSASFLASHHELELHHQQVGSHLDEILGAGAAQLCAACRFTLWRHREPNR